MNEVTCRDVARSVSAFLDGELGPAEILAIRAHLDECEACANRVAFARASRSSVRRTQQSVKASPAFQSHLRDLVTASTDEDRRALAHNYMLSWKIVGPVVAAAGFALLWGTMTRWQTKVEQSRAATESSSASSGVQSMAMTGSIDAIVNMLVEQHANPLPPETADLRKIQQYGRFVDVPVRWLDSPARIRTLRAKFLGMRVIALRETKRAAMFQYSLNRNRRLSVYVYNPSKVSVANSHLLRRRIINESPVYCGYVRGYSVAVTARHGVGYAVASDLDERDTSEIVASVGQ